jgi:predicted nucleic acid-binding protein
MSIVVADASPLHYLVLIDAIHVLPDLFKVVIVPATVWDEELRHDRTPIKVRDWASQRPHWIEVVESDRQPEPALLDMVDLGEANAIALAQIYNCPLLIDDKAGRLWAEAHGIEVIGTLGILLEAALRGLLDLESAVDGLLKTNAHLSRALVVEILTVYKEKSKMQS